jgi:hypothetical protein
VMSDDELLTLLDDADGDFDQVVLSYEDALRYLRRQKLVCRGPIEDAQREQIGQLMRAGKHSAALAHERRTRGVLNRSTRELEPCGYDFVDMIAETKHPLDGSLMSYRCPKCGVAGEMRVARLNVSDAPSVEQHEKLHTHFMRSAHDSHIKRQQLAALRARHPASR